jgi:hypothetical protein
MSTIYFNSDKNYLKRSPASGQSSMLGPVTSEHGGYDFQRTTTINHGLGFVPFCRVYYEPFGNSMVFPIISLPNDRRANNIFTSGSSTGPGLIYWADSSNLYIKLYYQNATLAANSYPIYYVIYEDFHIA